MEKLNSIQLSFKCPKKFNELLPCNGGWYCNECEKVVQDFRGKSEQEIQLIFARNSYNMCGMFEADRIRIKMPLNKWLKWVSAAAITLGFTGLHQIILAQQLSKEDSLAMVEKIPAHEEVIFGGPEQQAEYPGGTEKLGTYLMANLKPDRSCHSGERAFVTFIINENGNISDVKVIRGYFSKKMNAQIIKIFENSIPWKPALQNGKKVRSMYTMPVTPLPK